MGYQRAKVYNLTFEEPDLADLQVKVRSAPIGEFLEIQDIWADSSADRRTQLAQCRQAFADHLISWNLEDDDGPVPATLEGLLGYDFVFIDALIGAWLGTIAGVPLPLAEPSSSGGRLVAPLIPMEPLSESRAS